MARNADMLFMKYENKNSKKISEQRMLIFDLRSETINF